MWIGVDHFVATDERRRGLVFPSGSSGVRWGDFNTDTLSVGDLVYPGSGLLMRSGSSTLAGAPLDITPLGWTLGFSVLVTPLFAERALPKGSAPNQVLPGRLSPQVMVPGSFRALSADLDRGRGADIPLRGVFRCRRKRTGRGGRRTGIHSQGPRHGVPGGIALAGGIHVQSYHAERLPPPVRQRGQKARIESRRIQFDKNVGVPRVVHEAITVSNFARHRGREENLFHELAPFCELSTKNPPLSAQGRIYSLHF